MVDRSHRGSSALTCRASAPFCRRGGGPARGGGGGCRKNNWKKTVGPNEVTDFQKFDIEQIDGPKTILATNLPNHPGDGITLRQTRSSSHIIMGKATAASNEILVSEKQIWNLINSNVTSVIFQKFSIFEISSPMTLKLGLTKL